MKADLNNPIKQSSLITLEMIEAKENKYLNLILKRNYKRLKKLAVNKFVYACKDGNIYYK